MAGADYTDGGGWSRLDQTGARELAEIIAGFSPRTLYVKSRLLLVLYSTLGRDGTTAVGYRRLAELAGVSKDQAKRFMSDLEKDGVLEACETVRNAKGEFTVRRFSWAGGVGQKSAPPGGRKPGKSAPRGGRKPGKSAPHQSVQSTQNTCTPCTHPGAGRLEPPARGPEGRPLTLTEQSMMFQPPNTNAFGGDADG